VVCKGISHETDNSDESGKTWRKINKGASDLIVSGGIWVMVKGEGRGEAPFFFRIEIRV